MSTYHDKIKEYLHEAEVAHTHAGKEVAFSGLLKSVFGISGLEIIPNIENYIKTGEARMLKGRMDLHLGRIIIEFKINLKKELEKAIEEIERYSEILNEKGEKITVCIITDGLIFKVYSIHNSANEVREIDFRKATPEQAILFLDTFLFSERKIPTADDLNMRFGPGSAIYERVVEELSVLFKGIKEPIKFNLWAKNMELVYGSTPPEEAFVSQTYLMILVRLILAKRLVKNSPPIKDAVTGKLFSSQGINIIEDDFFSWILHPLFWHQVKELLEAIANALDIYDLEAVDEDIFKEIYQDIVKRGDRHKLGEYYTPEWFAELTLNEAIAIFDPKQEKGRSYSILDPACGSGTFLTNAIKILKRNGCSLETILDNVYGLDLNPLSVTIARANYLLALGKLVEKRKSAIFIPVFMCDSIKLPVVRKELLHGMDILAVDATPKYQLDLPVNIALNDNELKKILGVFDGILIAYRAKPQRLNQNQALQTFENSYKDTKEVIEVLKRTLSTLMKLIDANEDSVWIFMMRNIYAPLRMSEKRFDLVVGNPPWISFKYIENSEYQNFIKSQVFNYRLLESKQTSLFTHMDTSTVFYCKSADVYLADDGVLAFIMPRSVLTGAKQHLAFKKQIKPKMGIARIIDAEKVNPLFNVDSCTIISCKGKNTNYPVDSLILKGTLPEKNMLLKNATKYIEKDLRKYSPSEPEKMLSPYYSRVVEGACIVPRTLWFIKFQQGSFGLNPDSPLVESLVLQDAKEPWKNVILKGEVESEFIFLTVTGKTLLPFKAQFLPIVLPIKRDNFKFVRLTPEELRIAGKLKMANWFDEAQKEWLKNATKTNLKNFPNVLSYVNYRNKLDNQKQTVRYFVIQTGSGTNIAAAVVDIQRLPKLTVGKAQIAPEGFIADHKTYWFGTNNSDEAYYLASILNSNVINNLIKKHQTRGKFGPRDIGRLPFEQNIPLFDPQVELHKELALLGSQAIGEAFNLTKTSRTKIKAAIPSMKQIDVCVSKLLSQGS